jgi:hypothetical protein
MIIITNDNNKVMLSSRGCSSWRGSEGMVDFSGGFGHLGVLKLPQQPERTHSLTYLKSKLIIMQGAIILQSAPNDQSVLARQKRAGDPNTKQSPVGHRID